MAIVYLGLPFGGVKTLALVVSMVALVSKSSLTLRRYVVGQLLLNYQAGTRYS